MNDYRENAVHRKGYNIIGPLLLILIGSLLLVDQLGLLNLSWPMLLQFWPLLLVLFGLQMLLGHTRIGAVALLLIGLVAAGAIAYVAYQQQPERSRAQETMAIPLEAVQEAQIDVDCGTCALEIDALDSGTNLIEAATYGEDIDVVPSYSGSGQQAQITINGDTTWPASIATNERWQLGLSPDVPLKLDIDAGVGNARLDLSQLSLQELALDCGIGNLELVLPADGSYTTRVSTGIGNVDIRVPEDRAVLVRIDQGLTSVDLGSRFVHQGDDYFAEGSGISSSRLHVIVEAGIGKVTIH